jgi:5'-3' exonuclease
MSIGLVFGGSKAWAYQRLSDNLQYKINMAIGNVEHHPLVIPSIDQDDDSLLFLDGKFVDMWDVDFMLKRVKRLGSNRAVKLLQYFGSIEKIKSADVSQLRKVAGIGQKLAERIIETL